MDIEICGQCRGRGFTERDEGNNWSPDYVRRVCRPCEGRGCSPIPASVTGRCPGCGHEILVRDIVPAGDCRHCGLRLMYVLPGCFYGKRHEIQRTIFNDNFVGAGITVRLPSYVEWKRWPDVLAAEPKPYLLFPGDEVREVRCREKSGDGGPGIMCGSFDVEILVVKNVDGALVEAPASRASVDVRQTFPARP